MTGIHAKLKEKADAAVGDRVQDLLGDLIQSEQYVGEVYSIGYESALVLIHDYYRRQVGGIPSLSFLIATRINPGSEIDYTKEDSSIILLRVMDAAPLPNASEAERVRVETAQLVSGELDTHWDSRETMDPATHNLLSFAGVKCRVIGTFYVDLLKDELATLEGSLALKFGSDLSNYYPNSGLKVYKPNAAALRKIVNYRDPDRKDLITDVSVTLGTVRYASTNRSFQSVSDVEVSIMPGDLLGQKTALFGMTRTGKSNTTKVILKSVYELRVPTEEGKEGLRIGQIVFDPNGEYANENAQDANSQDIPTAIKNVWKVDNKSDDVVTYGILAHAHDPTRKLMLLNFFLDDNLQIGKDIIDSVLTREEAKYVRSFCQVVFTPPESSDRSALTRYSRRVLVYRTLLSKAGFVVPANINPQFKGLFGDDLRKAMKNSTGSNASTYQNAANILDQGTASWGEMSVACAALNEFINDGKSGYQQFEASYITNSSSGEPWADEDLKKLLGMFGQPNGPKLIGKVREQHTPNTSTDFAADIYRDLVDGKLVIIDQSSGDPEINASSAERIMWHIFRSNQEEFRKAQTPPQILIYVEEAHNLLPTGSDMDLKSVWVRTAKEGAKYNLGLVYATQEVSSIQRNILKNTANWFIGHLNNTDETKELCKYYDFADFEGSIRRAQDRGFIRAKTLSNLFVVPIQVRKFEV